MEQVDARKHKMPARQALALARQVDHIYAAKGKSVVHIDLKKEKPSDDALLKILLGPSGNLRAPALRRGRTLIVGFDETMFESRFTS